MLISKNWMYLLFSFLGVFFYHIFWPYLASLIGVGDNGLLKFFFIFVVPILCLQVMAIRYTVKIDELGEATNFAILLVINILLSQFGLTMSAIALCLLSRECF